MMVADTQNTSYTNMPTYLVIVMDTLQKGKKAMLKNISIITRMIQKSNAILLSA